MRKDRSVIVEIAKELLTNLKLMVAALVGKGIHLAGFVQRRRKHTALNADGRQNGKETDLIK